MGGPSSSLGAGALHNQGADHNAFGYRGFTADGRELRCSSVYFRNFAARVIAGLCINFDISIVQRLQSLQDGAFSAEAHSAIRPRLPPFAHAPGHRQKGASSHRALNTSHGNHLRLSLSSLGPPAARTALPPATQKQERGPQGSVANPLPPQTHADVPSCGELVPQLID
jgi:hypothetical protein